MARAKDEVVLRFRDVCEPVLADLGYDLVSLEHTVERGPGRSPRKRERADARKILRIFIDRLDPAAGPISIDDCVKVTRELDPVLEVAEVVPGRYELEVSSPGINRPLARRGDFERFAGQKVAVRTFEKVGDRRNFIGTLLGVEGDEVRIDVDGREHRVPLGAVSKANLDVL